MRAQARRRESNDPPRARPPAGRRLAFLVILNLTTELAVNLAQFASSPVVCLITAENHQATSVSGSYRVIG